jgi:hypothetical protein
VEFNRAGRQTLPLISKCWPMVALFPFQRKRLDSPALESSRINSSAVPSEKTSPVVSMASRQVAPSFSCLGRRILAMISIVRPVHLSCDAQDQRERHLEPHCLKSKGIQKNQTPQKEETKRAKGKTGSGQNNYRLKYLMSPAVPRLHLFNKRV